MRIRTACCLFLLAAGWTLDPVVGQSNEKESDMVTVMVVCGAEGTPEYGEQFAKWAETWKATTQKAQAKLLLIGRAESNEKSPTADRELLKRALSDEPKSGPALWLVLLGHGTFDGRTAKFNLRGPDLSAADLSEWLAPFERPVAVILGASASGPFLPGLSREGRVVVTAAKSGHEVNFSRFGEFFTAAVADPASDLDKDGQTSLLEAYLVASRQTVDFYKNAGRLATEHALLDDNGDSLGTPADWFRAVRATRRAKDGASLDGHRAHQFHLLPSDRERRLTPEVRARRDALELSLARLRDTKDQFAADDYYGRLQTILVELAELYEQSQ